MACLLHYLEHTCWAVATAAKVLLPVAPLIALLAAPLVAWSFLQHAVQRVAALSVSALAAGACCCTLAGVAATGCALQPQAVASAVARGRGRRAASSSSDRSPSSLGMGRDGTCGHKQTHGHHRLFG